MRLRTAPAGLDWGGAQEELTAGRLSTRRRKGWAGKRGEQLCIRARMRRACDGARAHGHGAPRVAKCADLLLRVGYPRRWEEWRWVQGRQAGGRLQSSAQATVRAQGDARDSGGRSQGRRRSGRTRTPVLSAPRVRQPLKGAIIARTTSLWRLDGHTSSVRGEKGRWSPGPGVNFGDAGRTAGPGQPSPEVGRSSLGGPGGSIGGTRVSRCGGVTSSGHCRPPCFLPYVLDQIASPTRQSRSG